MEQHKKRLVDNLSMRDQILAFLLKASRVIVLEKEIIIIITNQQYLSIQGIQRLRSTPLYCLNGCFKNNHTYYIHI